jgi:hypothetical protein
VVADVFEVPVVGKIRRIEMRPRRFNKFVKAHLARGTLVPPVLKERPEHKTGPRVSMLDPDLFINRAILGIFAVIFIVGARKTTAR